MAGAGPKTDFPVLSAKSFQPTFAQSRRTVPFGILRTFVQGSAKARMELNFPNFVSQQKVCVTKVEIVTIDGAAQADH